MVNGQEKLMEIIDGLTIDNLPSSLIIVGEQGSGKTTIINEIAKKVNLPIIEITDKLTLDDVFDIYSSLEPSIYYIDWHCNLTDLKQNAILKLLEEPPVTAKIIIECVDINTLLPTIQNRCQVWKMQSYTKDFLSKYAEERNYDLRVIDIVTTPGQIEQFSGDWYNDFVDFCDKVIAHIGSVSLPSIYNITNKIRFNDSNKEAPYDANMVLKYLCKKYSEFFKTDNLCYNKYKLTKEFIKEFETPNVIGSRLFEKYLLELHYTDDT